MSNFAAESSGRLVKAPDSCVMVIFGATGDLTKRLVIPALYNLSRTHALSEDFSLVGVARGDETAESWINALHAALKSYVRNPSAVFNIDQIDEEAWNRLTRKVTFISGDLNDPALYRKVRGALDEVAKARGAPCNALFYLAIVDHLFGVVVDQLGKAGLTEEGKGEGSAKSAWRRVVIEKPFGHDLAPLIAWRGFKHSALPGGLQRRRGTNQGPQQLVAAEELKRHGGFRVKGHNSSSSGLLQTAPTV